MQDDPNGEGYAPAGGAGAGHYYPAPPPAHYRPPARQPTPVKEEPGLDMSGWSHPGYQVSPAASGVTALQSGCAGRAGWLLPQASPARPRLPAIQSRRKRGAEGGKEAGAEPGGGQQVQVTEIYSILYTIYDNLIEFIFVVVVIIFYVLDRTIFPCPISHTV